MTDDNNHSRLHPYHDDNPHLPEHRHNYRKRFTDAIKGVFSDLINRNKNSSSLSSSPVPILLDQVVPSHPSPSKESTENNSSRLKRQLDFGSGASSEEQNENSKEEYRTTQPSAMKYTPPTKRPFLRVIQMRRKSSRPVSAESPSSSSPSSVTTTTSSEEIPISDERSNSEGGNSSRERFRKRPFRRFRPSSQKNRNIPKLERVSSKEKYDISEEDNEPSRKNFTLEVVQLERKIVRKQDGHIPPLFKQGNFNIQPRLIKVSKQDNRNRPQVLYKRGHKSDSPSVTTVPQQRASSRHGKTASPEISSKEFDKNSGGDASSEERRGSVVVNLNSQIPYNDRDLSDEDLKDYHDGHSTFGSKGNFTHTILSRNVAGFVPNQSGENSNRRNKGDRTIVIQKGKVTERYPEDDNPFKNPNIEIYSVPGGRSSSTENSAPKQEAFPFTRTSKRTKEAAIQDNDRTSPAIPSSLEELYKKGHPGVVPAPKKASYHKNPLSDPYGDNAVYTSPFKYNPLEDEPPLKFDPESDRFYGEPVPDNKERVAQSNSPAVQVESGKGKADRTGILQPDDDFFRPVKRESEEDKSSSREDDQSASREQRPRNQNDRFFYGRAYNPPDYATEYDTEAAGDGENRRDSPNDQDNFDFVGLDENFGPSHNDDTGGVDSDFFEFPEGLGGLGGGRGGGARFRPRADQAGKEGEHDEGRRNNNDDDANRDTGNSNRDFDDGTASREEEPVRRSPPPPPRQSSGKDDDDYDFGPAPVRNAEVGDNEGHPELYDTGFIHTLKQFDEEIKKLQDEGN